jgi:hypothetical protein
MDEDSGLRVVVGGLILDVGSSSEMCAAPGLLPTDHIVTYSMSHRIQWVLGAWTRCTE